MSCAAASYPILTGGCWPRHVQGDDRTTDRISDPIEYICNRNSGFAQCTYSALTVHVQCTSKNCGFSTVHVKSEWQGVVGYLPTQI